MIYISPAEHNDLATLGKVSSLPEQHGSDILILTTRARVGIQRKAIPDFLASLQDGRLAKEFGQMTDSMLLQYRVLIIEGHWQWTSDGALMTSYGPQFTRNQLQAVITSTQVRGVIVHHTDDLNDTMALVRTLVAYFDKAKHSSLDRRPKLRDSWGRITSESFGIHLLQSFPGIGPDTARSLYAAFGVPFEWSVTAEQLESVPGIGRRRARALIAAFAPRS